MPYGFLDIAVTPSVAAAQKAMGSDGLWTDFKGDRVFDRFTDDEAAFIAGRDSFYMATVSENQVALHPAPRRAARFPEAGG